MRNKVDKYEKCKCGQTATWLYMPGSMPAPFFCDDCVPRGCSCNQYSVTEFDMPSGVENVDWKWIDKDKTLFTYIDKTGREWPCCEFEYEEDGWQKESK